MIHSNRTATFLKWCQFLFIFIKSIHMPVYNKSFICLARNVKVDFFPNCCLLAFMEMDKRSDKTMNFET